ncbi:MAG: phosphoglycerate kinase [Deltaproteobacteria bacterium]|nr:phosphoglycerate kinase [Deltaproteobacteria bacterium]MBW1845924.1 phosphoglycerate kinase [Deltaproteobacteria bacterium]
MEKLTIEDIEIKGKRILTRVDYNVPIESGLVVSDVRIKASLPTLEYILGQGGRLILMSHLGRPKGERIPEMSLRPCAHTLGKFLGKEVVFIDDCIGESVLVAVQKLKEGEILLLENLRYYKEETENDKMFAEKLAALGDIYVNDAFGTAHRAHASTEGITHCMGKCVAGFLLKKELDYLGRVVENAKKPFVTIIGGAKISDKISVVSNMLPKVEKLILGGGMAFTFLKALGHEIGNSLCEQDKVKLAKDILKTGGDKIELPVDCVISDFLDFNKRKIGNIKEINIGEIPQGWMGLDIGQKSIKRFGLILENAKTIVWNGPMGLFEIDETAKGTYAIANILAKATQSGAITIIGGGDLASAVNKAGVSDKVSHISTGGGASLEFLEGKILPGVAALSDK